ncbi:hypothetical protein HU200_067613 [Digitaria exilis]|uniref:Uncharacterized protein n=1 Tax=Digitaria exilis TaxID=1010633 RepID=A0A834ZW38_9POAL|nr:hypothetical protein HU200_067613 [Digitaria exilis]
MEFEVADICATKFIPGEQWFTAGDENGPFSHVGERALLGGWRPFPRTHVWICAWTNTSKGVVPTEMATGGGVACMPLCVGPHLLRVVQLPTSAMPHPLFLHPTHGSHCLCIFLSLSLVRSLHSSPPPSCLAAAAGRRRAVPELFPLFPFLFAFAGAQRPKGQLAIRDRVSSARGHTRRGGEPWTRGKHHLLDGDQAHWTFGLFTRGGTRSCGGCPSIPSWLGASPVHAEET